MIPWFRRKHKTCLACRHSMGNERKELECRRYPAVLVVIKTIPSGPNMGEAVLRSKFPIASGPCGEWSR